LGKLRLAVRPKILVSEALDYLEIAVHPTDHKKLFEELGRLGQGIKFTLMDPTGDQIIPGPLRGTLG
jgi:hypothetical protein